MAGVFLFCQLGDTVCFICWTGFARSLQKNPFPGSAGISQASVQPQVDLFLHSRFCQRENKAAAAPVAAAAASFKNLQHTNTTNLSKAPYFFFFFVFLTTVRLCYFFAFYLFIRLSFFSFFTAGSSNPPENSTFPVPPARMCSRSFAALLLCAVLCN